MLRKSAPSPGPPGSTQANQQAAVVQDLARRHKVSCPAHPAHRGPWQGQFSSQAQQASLRPSQAASSVAAPSVAAARLEYTFASPAFNPASDADQVWSVEHSLSMDSTVGAFSESAGLWANFCVQHDTTHECLHPSPGQHYRPNCSSSNDSTSERQSQLQAAFADINIRKAILKDPMLLSYCPNTLAGHIHHLQLLVGKPEASAMIAKMPTLLHYKTATLSTKLDEMYDLLPKADVSKMVVRSPFLLGLSYQTLTTRIAALQAAFPDAEVQRMVEYYPSLLECKIGKVVGNLKALQLLLPETVDTMAVVQYMPTLLLSDMKKVEEKYTRMQILCMHKPRWRKDLISSQQKPATFARLLGVSHKVLDRLSFLLDDPNLSDLAASTVMLMSRAKFATRFEQFQVWQNQRNAAEHINMWQSQNALVCPEQFR